jgi:hypothetical protein
MSERNETSQRIEFSLSKRRTMLNSIGRIGLLDVSQPSSSHASASLSGRTNLKVITKIQVANPLSTGNCQCSTFVHPNVTGPSSTRTFKFEHNSNNHTSGTPISCIYMEYTMYIPCICRPDRYPWDIHGYPWIYHVYPRGWIYLVYTWISMDIHHVYTTYIHGYTWYIN